MHLGLTAHTEGRWFLAAEADSERDLTICFDLLKVATNIVGYIYIYT